MVFTIGIRIAQIVVAMMHKGGGSGTGPTGVNVQAGGVQVQAGGVDVQANF
jgi:hypothetical protein